LSLTIVLMPIVGGLGTVAGPVLGAILFGYLQIKMLSMPALRDSYLFLYGGLLIAVTLFEPKGLVGLFGRARRLASRPMKGPVPNAG
jgi:ABC-type branched-subunit amino acid transport system permease subunit